MSSAATTEGAVSRRARLIGKGWIQGVALVMLFGFTVMGLLAYRTYTNSMPQPQKVVTESGETVFTTQDITEGQKLFQARGLMEDGSILVTRPDDERRSRSLHGLSRTLINNMVIGVTEGYSKQLEIVGTGYRVAAKGQSIELSLGFSHTVTVEPPEGITFTVDGNLKITVSGISKEQVGEVAANIRKIRPPEPYKGKGVRYAGENVRRKVGKAGK